MKLLNPNTLIIRTSKKIYLVNLINKECYPIYLSPYDDNLPHQRSVFDFSNENRQLIIYTVEYKRETRQSYIKKLKFKT